MPRVPLRLRAAPPRAAEAQRRAPRRALVAVALALSTFAVGARAHADTLVIRHPGDHPRYSFEAEPHLLAGVVDPPGIAHGDGFGIGFRGTETLLDNGFIPRINNSVGIGFGLDWVHYSRGRLRCTNNPGQNGVCVLADDESVDDVWIPVVLQWNFWLSRQWSVFGEPGAALRYESPSIGGHLHLDAFQFYAGGRWHFSDAAALTMRVGYPTFSVGVSFLL